MAGESEIDGPVGTCWSGHHPRLRVSFGDAFTVITPAYVIVYAGYMSKVVPVREFRSHLAELLDEVATRREHVTITRHGRPEAVVVPIDEYEALEETAEILSDDDTLEAIRRGLGELAAGDVATLEELRSDLERRADA